MNITNNERLQVAAPRPDNKATSTTATMFDMAVEKSSFDRSAHFPRCHSHVENGSPSPTPAVSTKKLHFPHRLFRMLEEIRQCRPCLSQIVSWHDDCDTAFVIKNLEAFRVEVMPVYFGSQSKFASFQRQLNNYDFHRVQDRRQNGSMIYWHKNFSRTHPHMIQEVVLKKCKTNQKHPSSTPPQLVSAVVLEMLLAASYTASSSNTLALEQVHYDDASGGDHILDEAVAQILGDASETVGTRSPSCPDYNSSQEHDAGKTLCWIPPVDQHDWDSEAESIVFCEGDVAITTCL
jgi:hypothetical protein